MRSIETGRKKFLHTPFARSNSQIFPYFLKNILVLKKPPPLVWQ